MDPVSRGTPEPPRFDEQSAARMVTEGDFALARKFFDAVGTRLTTAANQHFNLFDRALLTRNPDNYGLYFVHQQARVPFLWLGMAWKKEDPPGTLPSWGASLEVDGAAMRLLEGNIGGVLDAFESLARHHGHIQLYRFDKHVELAEWRSFSWLLAQEPQARALEDFWGEYLAALEAADLPQKVEEFIQVSLKGS